MAGGGARFFAPGSSRRSQSRVRQNGGRERLTRARDSARFCVVLMKTRPKKNNGWSIKAITWRAHIDNLWCHRGMLSPGVVAWGDAAIIKTAMRIARQLLFSDCLWRRLWELQSHHGGHGTRGKKKVDWIRTLKYLRLLPESVSMGATSIIANDCCWKWCGKQVHIQRLCNSYILFPN